LGACSREGSNPSPGNSSLREPETGKGVIGERTVPYAFRCGGRTISGRGKHPLLRLPVRVRIPLPAFFSWSTRNRKGVIGEKLSPMLFFLSLPHNFPSPLRCSGDLL